MFKSTQTLSLLAFISAILFMALLKYQDDYQDFINHLELRLGQMEAIKEKADIILDQPQGIKTCLDAGTNR